MDMYLRILKAIDEEVVDRDVIRSQQVNFVNCFLNYNAAISMGENKSSTKRGTIKQKLITCSIRTILYYLTSHFAVHRVSEAEPIFRGCL